MLAIPQRVSISLWTQRPCVTSQKVAIITTSFLIEHENKKIIVIENSHLSPWDTKALLPSPGLSRLRCWWQPRHIPAPPAPPRTSSTTSHGASHASNTPQPLSLCLTSPQGSSKLKRKQVWTAPARLETKIWRTASQRRSSGTGPLLLDRSGLSDSRLLAAAACWTTHSAPLAKWL